MSAVRLLPWVLHSAVEYLAGLFFLLAPFIFGFRDEAAPFAFFMAVGLVVLIVAMLSPGRLGVLGVLPIPVHATADYVLGVFLIVAPFVFFPDARLEQNIAIFLGIAHLVISLITRFPRPREVAAPDGVEPAPDLQAGAGLGGGDVTGDVGDHVGEHVSDDGVGGEDVTTADADDREA